MSTFGPAYDKQDDEARLRQQHWRIRALMIDGQWRTLADIANDLAYPEASISAQLRHLRKPEFGEYHVDKRRRMGGLWEYRVRARAITAEQYNLFEMPGRIMAGH